MQKKIQTTRIAVTLKTNKKLWNFGTAMDTAQLMILMT
ncbi:Lpxtg-motif cell wall anchor domain protein [Bacillus thuringiensis serovar berliner ATCC 10792]|nr:Lpxtg-motif cell wall anchor domain protein [Bacillus thuringiensis serovar berliner ATCC 10792]